MGHFRPKPLIRAMSALHPKATAKADMRAVGDAQLLRLRGSTISAFADAIRVIADIGQVSEKVENDPACVKTHFPI